MLDKARKRELCQILGVPQDADEATIRRKYYELAKQHHPDKKGDSDAMDFTKFTEAYDQLKSGYTTLNSLKSHFNKEIHSSLEHFLFTTNSMSLGSLKFASNGTSTSDTAEKSTSSPKNSQSNVGSTLQNLGNLSSGSFGSFDLGTSFTGLLAKKKPKKGHTLKTTLKINYKEALEGCTKVLEYTRSIICRNCSQSSKSTNQCRECGGKGTVVACIGGSVSVTTACTTCQPANTSPLSAEPAAVCSVCKGTGKVKTKKTCTVEVPAGVSTGTTKVFVGEGDEGTDGGPPGDFIVAYDVEPHPRFRREGDNAYCSVVVPFPHAALGTRMVINSLYETPLEIELDSGIQHNQIVRLGKQGFRDPKTGARGDMFIQIFVEVPRNLNQREQKLLEKLAKEPNFTPKQHCEINTRKRGCPSVEESPAKKRKDT